MTGDNAVEADAERRGRLFIRHGAPIPQRCLAVEWHEADVASPGSGTFETPVSAYGSAIARTWRRSKRPAACRTSCGPVTLRSSTAMSSKVMFRRKIARVCSRNARSPKVCRHSVCPRPLPAWINLESLIPWCCSAPRMVNGPSRGTDRAVKEDYNVRRSPQPFMAHEKRSRSVRISDRRRILSADLYQPA